MREAQVIAPSEMIAVGDAYSELFRPGTAYPLTQMLGYQLGDLATAARARASAKKRHTGRFNLLFCDGHVEHAKPEKLFEISEPALRRLNRDNQSHISDVLTTMYPSLRD